MNSEILITGATGFLGSHIAEILLLRGYQLTALKRRSSDLWRCAPYAKLVEWIDVDAEGWETQLADRRPEAIIHTAWDGVGAGARDNWELQSGNLVFMTKLLGVAATTGCPRVIGFGSQAEYGVFSGKVDESLEPNPMSAYGTVKLLCCEMLENFARIHQQKWYWLRLFSFFGEKEADNWLIPSVIKKLQKDDEMDFTPGEQRYAYMYVRDMAFAVAQLIGKTDAPSGVYNLSGNDALSLKEIIESISLSLNSNTRLNFGALPYRPNQPMHIEGDTSKYEQYVGPLQHTDFNQNLLSTISFYKLK